MSVLQLRFTFLMDCFSKLLPLLPIYGDRIQTVEMLFLFTNYFSCFRDFFADIYNKDLCIYLEK